MTGDCNELLEKRIREYVPDFDSELYRNILSNFSWKWQENIPTGVLHMAMHTGSKTVVEKYLHFMDDYSDEPGAGWGLLSSVGDVAVYAEPETTETE